MPFIGTLRVEFVEDAHDLKSATWRVLSPLTYESPTEDISITVPPGFITDFASVPRIPIAFEIDGDIAESCAVVHDYLYQTGQTTRLVADLLLRQMMKERQFGWFRRWSIYFAVRLFGGAFYKQPWDSCF